MEGSAAAGMEVVLDSRGRKRVGEGGLGGRRASRNPSRGVVPVALEGKRKAAETQPGRGTEERNIKSCRRAGEERSAPEGTGVQSLPVRVHA